MDENKIDWCLLGTAFSSDHSESDYCSLSAQSFSSGSVSCPSKAFLCAESSSIFSCF